MGEPVFLPSDSAAAKMWGKRWRKVEKEKVADKRRWRCVGGRGENLP